MDAGSRGARGLYEQAVAHFRSGRIPQAEAALRHCLAAEPGRAEALELLGTLLNARGHFGEALQWLDRAREARPSSPSVRHNRAQALQGLGRNADALEELRQAVKLKPDQHPSWNLMAGVLADLGDAPGAERAYARALALRPDHAETHYNLALLLQQSGRLEEAGAGYRKALALRPRFAAAHNNLANALRALGRLEEALAHYAEATRIEPALADAWSNWGSALRERGRIDEAIPLLERALTLTPRSWAVQNNLGIAYFQRNRYAEAIECYRRALELRDDFHEARNHLGNALAALGRQDEALACYRRVLAEAPGYADAHNNLGLLLQEQGDRAGALAAYERALRLDPGHADATNNVGHLLQEEGRREEAMAHYRRAAELAPDAPRPAYNLGLAHLFGFEFAEGWRRYDVRFATDPPIAIPRALPMPRLAAGDLGRGHRVALWREQGVGDQVLYSTLVPELEARGERFVLEVDRRLVAAYARAHPAWEVVAPEQSEAAFARCDRQLAIGSLPGLLRPSAASFDGQPRALLAADAARAAAFRERLAREGGLVVGISWRSFQPAARGSMQRRKSAPLASFQGLSRRPDVRLLDLQYGDTAAEREAFDAQGGRLARLEELDLFNDLEGVLAAIAACDAVVTTSNVTAHLAGALGKRTLLVYLAGNPPFHYWVAAEGGRCLWYPSVRIVTGTGLDTWDKALARVDELLPG